ncbi:uncharacterized protein LOC144123794 [Amblyomma americanum]
MCPVPEHSLDEDFGAVLPVVAHYSETAANVTWMPGEGSLDCEISTGWEAEYALYSDAGVNERVAQCCPDVRCRDQGNDVEQHDTKTPESGVPETDRCWSSEESAYALLPATGPSPAASSSSAFPPLTSPGGQNTRDTVGSGASEQLVVHMPYPLSPVPVGQLLPGPSSERVFGELLGECKHRVPLTFHAMLHDIGADGCVKLCENGPHSEVFRTSGVRGVAVIKVLHPAYLIRHLPLLLNEVRVGRQEAVFDIEGVLQLSLRVSCRGHGLANPN